jgi:peroxiredoxin
MEKNNEWVEDRLAKLNPDSEWQPHVPAALARFEGRRSQTRFIGRWPRMVSVAGVAAVCILIFPAPRAAAQRALAPCVDACQNLVLNHEDIHEHFFQFAMAFHHFLGLSSPAMIGENKRRAAPDFLLTDATGASFRLSDYKGKVVLLNFWASWCEPCKTEIPWFVELQRTRANQGFAVIGISLDEDGWKAVRPLMESAKVNYRVAIGDDALVQKFGGVESLPETLLIDREGRIAVRHVGIANKVQYAVDIDYILGKGHGTT